MDKAEIIGKLRYFTETIEDIAEIGTADRLIPPDNFDALANELLTEIDEYAQQVSREAEGEILNELISIKEYMEERDAFYGYGQISDLITKLENLIGRINNGS